MANGRLRSVTIPPYSSAEIYHNSDSSASSITIHGQVLSDVENSKVSVAVTATDYSSTIMSTTVESSQTNLNVCNCLMSVAYCTDSSETFNGYITNVGGISSGPTYYPTYSNAADTQYSRPASQTSERSCILCECYLDNDECGFAIDCFENGGFRDTWINPKILCKYSSGRFLAYGYCTESATCGYPLTRIFATCRGDFNEEITLKSSIDVGPLVNCYDQRNGTNSGIGTVIHMEDFSNWSCGGDPTCCCRCSTLVPWNNCRCPGPTQFVGDLWSDTSYILGSSYREKTICACCSPNIMVNVAMYAVNWCRAGRTVSGYVCTFPGIVHMSGCCTPCMNNCCYCGVFCAENTLPGEANNWGSTCCGDGCTQYLKGPIIASGCEVIATKRVDRIHIKSTKSSQCCPRISCQLWSVQACVCCYPISSTQGGGALSVALCIEGANGGDPSLRWLAYNPSQKCNVFMTYSGQKSDGIYSIDHTTLIECTTACNASANAINGCTTPFTSSGDSCCLYWCHTFENGPVKKVSDIPDVFINNFNPKTMCVSRLAHIDTCLWILPVNDGTSWSLMSSTNLCDWVKAGDDTLNCFTQLTDKLNIYTSSQGNGICKISNNYSTISTDGTIDYEVTANQYQQTGVVVSSGDRLYAKNNGPCRMSFTVWGYEG